MLAKCSIKYRVLMGVQFPCTQSSEQIINPDGCPLQNPYFAAIPWPFQFWKSTTNNPKTNHYQSYLRQLDIFAWFQRCVRRVILEVFANFATQSFTLKSNFISVSKCGILKSTSWCPGVCGERQRSSVGSWRYTDMLQPRLDVAPASTLLKTIPWNPNKYSTSKQLLQIALPCGWFHPKRPCVWLSLHITTSAPTVINEPVNSGNPIQQE